MIIVKREEKKNINKIQLTLIYFENMLKKNATKGDFSSFDLKFFLVFAFHFWEQCLRPWSHDIYMMYIVKSSNVDDFNDFGNLVTKEHIHGIRFMRRHSNDDFVKNSKGRSKSVRFLYFLSLAAILLADRMYMGMSERIELVNEWVFCVRAFFGYCTFP